MILFLSNFTVVVEKVELDVKAEVIVVVVIDESALAVFYYKIIGLIFFDSILKD